MRSQAGISLVLVMIGLSIVSVILLAVFRLLDLSRDMAASFQNVMKAADAMQEVRFAFGDVNTCTANLKDLVPGPPSNPTEIRKQLTFAIPQSLRSDGRAVSEPQPIITFGGTGGAAVEISRITLSQADVPTPNTAILNLEMTRKGVGTAAISMRRRSIPVWIKTDNAGRIGCCTTRSLSLCR